LWEPIRAGEVRVAYRRWFSPRVLAGRVYRTPAGRLEVTAVDRVDEAAIADDDAVRAGFPSAAALLSVLRAEPGRSMYRIAFRFLDEPDPRAVLASSTTLDAEELRVITRRLARLDAASTHGPWTIACLEAIEAHPERRAPDLAAMFERPTQPFKVDVRKLKALSLTESFRIGYRLSPRGEAYLRWRRSGAGRAAPDGEGEVVAVITPPAP
jgi:hypothetical protein